MIFIVIITTLFLAYSNGANDNFKGVATLFGSGTADFKSALNWATATTFLGSLAAIFLAQEMVKNFSGKGLVPDELIQNPAFAISIALGAAITVFTATKIGMPISTTHSLVGALFGSGVIAVGSTFNFVKLGSIFLVPLILSPLMAAVLSLGLYVVFRRLRKALNITKETCICVGDEFQPVAHVSFGNANLETASAKTLKIASRNDCAQVYMGSFMGISAQKLLDNAHYLSSGVVSFARGLNDTPKIVGLLVVINALDIRWGMIAIAIAMAIGGLLNARKVGETMSKKITTMNHGQGFTANLITGLLVTTASLHGLPVSTTHVSVGSLFGISAVSGQANFRTITKILLSWVITLPFAALISGLTFFLLKLL